MLDVRQHVEFIARELDEDANEVEVYTTQHMLGAEPLFEPADADEGIGHLQRIGQPQGFWQAPVQDALDCANCMCCFTNGTTPPVGK